MPIRIAPFTRRAISAAITSRLASAIAVSGWRSDPKVTGGSATFAPVASTWMVPGGTITKRAFTSPMNAMKRPIPTPIARRRSLGMARIRPSRNPTSTRTSMVSPSRTTRPIAVCQDPAAGATW